MVNELDNQDKTFVSRADFLPFFYAICLGQNPAETQPPQRQPLPSRTGFNKRYLAGNRAGALGAIALVPGELRAALAPSRLLLLVHAFISWPTWSTSSAGGCAALGDCTEPRLLFDSRGRPPTLCRSSISVPSPCPPPAARGAAHLPLPAALSHAVVRSWH